MQTIYYFGLDVDKRTIRVWARTDSHNQKFFASTSDGLKDGNGGYGRRFVAPPAKCDQVFGVIISEAAARLFMIDGEGHKARLILVQVVRRFV